MCFEVISNLNKSYYYFVKFPYIHESPSKLVTLMKFDTSIRTPSTGDDPLEVILAGGVTGVFGLRQIFVTLSNVSPLGQGMHVSF